LGRGQRGDCGPYAELILRDFSCAIIDCSDIIDGMASITIRQLPETTKRKLRMRAAQNGRSMEQEAREILKNELSKTPVTGKDLVKSIRDIFEPLGGVDLQIPPRGPIRDPGIR
jgi:antitoxin FitA